MWKSWLPSLNVHDLSDAGLMKSCLAEQADYGNRGEGLKGQEGVALRGGLTSVRLPKRNTRNARRRSIRS